MKSINQCIGARIRGYRKMKGMTLQQLADAISKSRPTVSKYETGDISLDIETLFDISRVLEVSVGQLTDCLTEREEYAPASVSYDGESPFFKADRLYFYFYDGRYDRLKEAVINVHKGSRRPDGCYETSMSIYSTTVSGRSSEIFYTGTVLYSDMLIRFTFLNQYNKLEQDLLYIFNPLELRTYTEGLLCGISSTDLMPCAFKCLVSLTPHTDAAELRKLLLLTPRDLRRWKKLNMLIVDNAGL